MYQYISSRRGYRINRLFSLSDNRSQRSNTYFEREIAALTHSLPIVRHNDVRDDPNALKLLTGWGRHDKGADPQ